MARNRVRELQSMSHKSKESSLKKEFLRDLKKKLAVRKYRADLKLITFDAVVKFNPALGYPSEEDLMSITGQAYPKHQIDWELVDVAENNGTVALVLEPAIEVIPIKSLKEIPAEFVSLGAGIYKKAANAAGNITEIWKLKKDEDGYVLYRSEDDFEVEADREDNFKAGDVVMTDFGPGKIKKFDDFGNAIVQVGSKKHLVAASDLKDYSQDADRKNLQDYFTQAYGDPTFSKALVEKLSKAPKGTTPWLDVDLGKKSKK
jgi:hypothetical protein